MEGGIARQSVPDKLMDPALLAPRNTFWRTICRGAALRLGAMDHNVRGRIYSSSKVEQFVETMHKLFNPLVSEIKI